MARVLVGVCVALVGVGVLVRLCVGPRQDETTRKADRTQAPSMVPAPPPASDPASPRTEANPAPGDPTNGPAPNASGSREVPEYIQKRREASEKRRLEDRKKHDEAMKLVEEDDKKRKEVRRKRDEELRAQGIDPSRLTPPAPIVEPPNLGPPVVTEKK